MTMRLFLPLLAAVAALLIASPAAARVERFAVLIGNNRGAREDVELRYAEAEASRMQDVLRDLGGLAPANTVLLRGESADTVRKTLITVNDRIRTAMAGKDAETILFVFYSGHADATSLHLGTTNLDMREIEQLVRGSAATLRLLVVDACRSGALTRTKGGTSAPPFAIQMDDRLAGDGMVLLTSTAANEDAQESDALQGSFFTHALVSGLLGAADTNGDEAVSLEEAYRYAYETTLRTTSRSWAGPQHPAFRFDLRGQGRVVLTDLAAHRAGRASFVFPPGRAYMVLAGSSEGNVIGEVGAHDKSRRLALKPGRYFVRGRGPAFLLEGEVRAGTGETIEVRDDLLRRVEYARLVRKGGGDDVAVAHGPQAGYRVRTPLPNSSSLCHGVFVGYPVELAALSIVPRLGACRGGFENAMLEAQSDELDFELKIVRSLDFSFVTVDFGIGAGASLFRQSFTTRAVAPDRTTFAGSANASLGFTRDLGWGIYALVDVEAQVYAFQLKRGNSDESSTIASFALRPAVGLGKRW